MSEIIKNVILKFERYEWMNIIIPGIFFVALCRLAHICTARLEGVSSALVAVLVSGMISSRIGAVVVESIVKRFEPFANYPDYVDWESSSPEKAASLTTNLNMFRSLTGMSVLLTSIILTRMLLFRLAIQMNLPHPTPAFQILALSIGLIILFGYSYKRQIKFIRSRVLNFKSKKGHN